jgi:hypothetical protein
MESQMTNNVYPAVSEHSCASTPARHSASYFTRDFLTTEEAAELLGLRPQTLRKAYSIDGCYFSVVPKKAVNRRLYWKTNDIRTLIEGV